MDETNQVELHRVEAFREFINRTGNTWTFATWLEVMELLQQIAYGAHYDDFEPDYRGDSMMMNLLAMHSEVDEMGQEVGWKPWAAPRGWVNREALINEAVDLMHFLANMLKHANTTGAELTAAYKAKVLKNLQRQINGYQSQQRGVDKCGYCGRELYGSTTVVKNGKQFCSIDHEHLYEEAFS